ncbi:hypothetical protein [Enteractinococcus helveticum]|nr:hypothetical protein [Enteractinococcus helveticum]
MTTAGVNEKPTETDFKTFWSVFEAQQHRQQQQLTQRMEQKK